MSVYHLNVKQLCVKASVFYVRSNGHIDVMLKHNIVFCHACLQLLSKNMGVNFIYRPYYMYIDIFNLNKHNLRALSCFK